MKAKYINSFTDFGFKKNFGEEASKPPLSQAFEKAEIAKFDEAELGRYENSLKIYRDLKDVIDTAFDDGKTEKDVEIATRMKQKGLAVKDIAELTELSATEIDKL